MTDATDAVLVRPLVPADLPAVLALERTLFPDDPWTAAMFADELAQPGRYYLAADEPIGAAGRAAAPVDAGAAAPRHGSPCAAAYRLVGYAGLMEPGGGQAEVMTLAVAADRWGRGIGSMLLTALLDEATRRGCVEVFLEVRVDNQRARALYLRHGFTEVGVRRGYYQPSGVDAIVMRRGLPDGPGRAAGVTVGRSGPARGGAW